MTEVQQVQRQHVFWVLRQDVLPRLAGRQPVVLGQGDDRIQMIPFPTRKSISSNVLNIGGTDEVLTRLLLVPLIDNKQNMNCLKGLIIGKPTHVSFKIKSEWPVHLRLLKCLGRRTHLKARLLSPHHFETCMALDASFKSNTFLAVSGDLKMLTPLKHCQLFQT